MRKESNITISESEAKIQLQFVEELKEIYKKKTQETGRTFTYHITTFGCPSVYETRI